jgi:hypothetical protein
MHKLGEVEGMQFCTTAAWNPQADGQSGRTNQVVIMAIRFYITAYKVGDWVESLELITFTINTSTNASLSCTPCKYIMGFNPHQPMDLAHVKPHLTKKDFNALKLQYRPYPSYCYLP